MTPTDCPPPVEYDKGHIKIRSPYTPYLLKGDYRLKLTEVDTCSCVRSYMAALREARGSWELPTVKLSSIKVRKARTPSNLPDYYITISLYYYYCITILLCYYITMILLHYCITIVLIYEGV